MVSPKCTCGLTMKLQAVIQCRHVLYIECLCDCGTTRRLNKEYMERVLNEIYSACGYCVQIPPKSAFADKGVLVRNEGGSEHGVLSGLRQRRKCY